MSNAIITIDPKTNIATITIHLQELGPSSSGKTNMVANVNGNNAIKVDLPNGKRGTFTITGYYKP